MSEFNISHIEQAAQRLHGHIVRTPVLNSPMLDKEVGCSVYVKAESLQRTGSFKFRGALNKMLSLPRDLLEKGVITYSAGNHGHAVAAAAHFVGCKAVVVLPNHAPQIKVDNCRWWGAEVVQYYAAKQDRAEVTKKIIVERGLTFIPPFDDVAIMGGQGTAGFELCEQLQEAGVIPDVMVVNCSGGGLASGVITALKSKWPQVVPCLVESKAYEKWPESLRSGKPVCVKGAPATVMEGIAGPIAGGRPLAALRKFEPNCLTVEDNDALNAMRVAFNRLKLVLEPGGAASLAAVIKNPRLFAGKKVVVVSSGGNVDAAIFAQAIS